MSLERARELLEQVRQLPVLPEQAQMLLTFSTSPDVTIEELLEVVERDPVLSAMVLRVVNSAAFGLGRSVSNLSQALVLLGTSHVRSLAVAASMAATLGQNDSPVSLSVWRDAFAVACASRVVAHQVYPLEASTAFAGGLLHHIGEIVIGSHFLQESSAINALIADGVDAPDAERSVLRATHAEIGSELAAHWGLPKVLTTTVLWHHGPLYTEDFLLPPNPGSVEALVSTSVQIAVCAWTVLDHAETPDTIRDVAELCSTVGVVNVEQLLGDIRSDVDRHLGAAGLATSGTTVAGVR